MGKEQCWIDDFQITPTTHIMLQVQIHEGGLLIVMVLIVYVGFMALPVLWNKAGCVHDDVIKWKHSLVTGEFPAQRPVMQSFDVFFDLHLN